MLHCDICTKTNNHCCKADIPLDPPIALALIEVSGNSNYENIFGTVSKYSL